MVEWSASGDLGGVLVYESRRPLELGRRSRWARCERGSYGLEHALHSGLVVVGEPLGGPDQAPTAGQRAHIGEGAAGTHRLYAAETPQRAGMEQRDPRVAAKQVGAEHLLSHLVHHVLEWSAGVPTTHVDGKEAAGGRELELLGLLGEERRPLLRHLLPLGVVSRPRG